MYNHDIIFVGGSMDFSFKINLRLFDMNSNNDMWDLIDIFEDMSLNEFIEDNAFAKYIYFIREDDKNIGFIYLLQYKNSNIYNLRYGIIKEKLNKNYIYTVLTLIRDKIKNKELENILIVTSVNKNSNYIGIVSSFGNLIYSNDLINYYNVNPNCEQLEKEQEKIYTYLKKYN